MILFVISMLLILLSSYMITGILNREKNIFGLIYIALLSFANIVFSVELLSLFSKISQIGILILNIIIFILSAVVWNKFDRPFWSVNCKSFFKKVYLACCKDKYLLILGLSWVFMMFVSLFLIIIMPVVSSDAESYHVLRSLFWIGNHNLNHFAIGDFRNLSMPINSEILYLWNIIFTKKLIFLSAFGFCGYCLSLISLNKIFDFMKISIRPKLWAIFIMSSFPAVMVQISGTETDIIIAGLVSSSIVLFWNAIRQSEIKYVSLFMSALAFALAIGTKTPAIIAIPAVGFFMTVLSVFYKKKEFYKPLCYFVSFGLINFILFASYNYILNLIDYGNIAGSENLIAAHAFNFGIQAIPANIVKHLFLFFDFTGFRWGEYLSGNLMTFREGIISFLHLMPCPDGFYSRQNVINQSLLESLMGLGVLGIITFVPCWILSFIIPIFKRDKKTILLLCFGIMLLVNFISISSSIQFMVYSIRFLMFFVVLSSPVLIYSYSKKNNPYKFIVTLFALYYLLLVSTHLWARPYYRIIKYLKSGYSISQVREISMCSLFLKKPLPVEKYYIQQQNFNNSCALKQIVEQNYLTDDKLLYFPNSFEELLQLKMLDFKGYKIDYKMMEDLDNINLSDYDGIFMLDNSQSSTVIRRFKKGTTPISEINPMESFKVFKGANNYNCRYLGVSKKMKDIVYVSDYPYSVNCNMNETYLQKYNFRKLKTLKYEPHQSDADENSISKDKFYNFYRKNSSEILNKKSVKIVNKISNLFFSGFKIHDYIMKGEIMISPITPRVGITPILMKGYSVNSKNSSTPNAQQNDETFSKTPFSFNNSFIGLNALNITSNNQKTSMDGNVTIKTTPVDYSKYQAYASNIISDVKSRVGVNGQFLNWIDVLPNEQLKNLDKIYNMAEKAKENPNEKLAIIGIGGSRHTTEAMINMFGLEDKVQFFSSIDPKSFDRFFGKLDLDNTKFLIVSKSGGTMETTTGYQSAKKLMQEHLGTNDVSSKFIAMTDVNPQKSKLRKLVDAGEFRDSGCVHDDVGGRFSIFDDATIFALAFSGVKKEDVKKMLEASLKAQKEFMNPDINKNDAMKLATFNADAKLSGKENHGVEYFGDVFSGATLWEKQMKNESLKSMVKTDTNVGPGYLHYNAEADLDKANKNSFYTFINVKTNDITTNAVLKGVKTAYTVQHPVSEIELKDLSPESIGRFIELKHFETLYTGNLLRRLNNNVTDKAIALPEVLQPNVEIYKKEVRKAMNQE